MTTKRKQVTRALAGLALAGLGGLMLTQTETASAHDWSQVNQAQPQLAQVPQLEIVRPEGLPPAPWQGQVVDQYAQVTVPWTDQGLVTDVTQASLETVATDQVVSASSTLDQTSLTGQTTTTDTTSLSSSAISQATANAQEANLYPIGQCTWGVKELAPWASNYWGNGGDWAANAAADGFTVGTTPVVGAIAVWTDGGYGHVAYVTEVVSETSIQVLEANVNGNQTIANHRGYFDPTTAQGTVTYIYPNT